MKNLFLVVLTFIFGSMTASVFGINPIVGGTASTALNLIPKGVDNQVAMAGITLTDLSAQLGAYSRKYEKEIWTGLFNSLQAENYMTPVPNVQDQYASPSAEITDVLQPYQSGWTPAGVVSFDARINKVFPIKFDIELDELDEIERSYIGFMADETKQRKDWPIVKFIIEELVKPKLIEELDWAAYNAAYVAPTPGTAGTPLTVADGVKTIIEAEILAGNLVPITVGALTPTTMVDKVELFVNSLPAKYRNKKMNLKMSTSNMEAYAVDYRDTYGLHNDYSAADTMKVWGKSNITIVPHDNMEGSDRFIATPKGNDIKLYDKIYTPKSLNIQADKRTVNVFGDFKRGWGFKRLDILFVSDNA